MTPDFAAEQDGMRARRAARFCARWLHAEISILHDIGNERGFTAQPHSPRQPDPASTCSRGWRLEVRDLDGFVPISMQRSTPARGRGATARQVHPRQSHTARSMLGWASSSVVASARMCCDVCAPCGAARPAYAR